VKKISIKAGDACPKCKTGQILKGKTAFGCSNYKTGCDYRLAFDTLNK
jgi:DNA topoisomerase-3